MKYLNLQTKITLVIFTLLISVSLLIGIYLINSSKKKAIGIAENYVKSLVSIIDDSINYYMVNGDRSSVGRIIERLAKDKNIIGIHIFSPEGELSCANSVIKVEDRKAYLSLIKGNLSQTETLKELKKDSTHFMAYYVPYNNKSECRSCHNKGDKIGILNVNISMDYLEEFLEKQAKTVRSINILTSILASILLSFLIKYLVVNPVKKLERGMQDVADNNLNIRVEIKSKDEFQYLGMFFNKMVSSLKKASKTIDSMQKSMVHSDRLLTVGKLTASLSHEMKNPLNSITITADLLAEKCKIMKDDDLTRRQIESIVTDAIRIKNIIDQTLNFSRFDTSLKEVLSIKEILGSIEIYSKRILFDSSDIAMSVSYSEDTGNMMLMVNRTNVEQLFINILKNAAESIPEGRSGILTIRSEIEDGNAVFSVSDNGVGMSKDVVQHIFEEFYTTKKEGTGLGLAIVKDILEHHEGHIDIVSDVGLGTTVYITLPIYNRNMTI